MRVVLQVQDHSQQRKGQSGIDAIESRLSVHTWKTNDPSKYLAYPLEKAQVDELTRKFYTQEKWRGWKFRMFCSRKSSEDRFLNRIADRYGKDCRVYHGDCRGCNPSPTVGVRHLVSKRFAVVDIDEFRTSVTCNVCKSKLSRYTNRRGRLLHSRLCCSTCGLEGNRSKRFVDRDINAAANVLWAGASPERPPCLRRSTSVIQNAFAQTSLQSVLRENRVTPLPQDGRC